MRSIAEHARLGYHDFVTSANASSCAYKPDPDDLCGVIDASAYGAFLPTRAGVDFSDGRYTKTAERNLNFVIESQNADGSWYYSTDGERDFVDHFHTCFVLKALTKIETLLGSKKCTQAIDRGVDYYVKNLFDDQGLPKGTVFIVTFHETKLAGVFEMRLELHSDERGFFARSWCEKEFGNHGLVNKLVQCSISVNKLKGTLRGVHYQAAPVAETKVVRCTAGAIYDVALDLREESPTFKQWHGTVLSSENRESLYIPVGCAHGFLTLTDESEVFYQMSQSYHPGAGRGVRWNDPAFQIEWPGRVEVISERDRTYPSFEPK
jgi:dTDP-4-dehydrorhamnose 3,5-epimerase